MRKCAKALLTVVMSSLLAVCSASCGCEKENDYTPVEQRTIVKSGDFNYAIEEDGNGTLSSISADKSSKELIMQEPENEKITKIGNATFVLYSDLEKVVMSENIEEIGESAFRGCKKLSDVTFSPKLKRIGSFAFSQTALKEVELPSSVETVETGAFSISETLEKVTINEGVTRLENICYLAINLKELHLPSTIKEIADDVSLADGVTVYTPDNSVVVDFCKKNNIKYELVK